MKRDQALIFMLALFIGGYVIGRATAKQTPSPVAAPAVALPGATPASVASASPAISSEPAPSPSPAPPPAPASEAKPAPSDPNQVWRAVLDKDKDPKSGPDTADIKIVVFAALGQPEVAEFAPALVEAEKKYGKQIQIIWKQKVILPPHPDTPIAGEAMLAAHAQGKFRPFWDKVTRSGQAVDRGSLVSIAKEVGIDIGRFEKDLDTGRHRGRALKDGLLANEIAAHSNPNIAVNGVRLSPPKNWDHLRELIDAQIEKAKGMGGKKGWELYDSIVKDGKQFEQTAGPKVAIAHDGSPTFGNPNAKVAVEVYEDFQCPFCSKLAPSIKEFAKKFPNDVKIVYKHMPLTSIHDKAQMASEASMAAHAQGKFWEYHDVLYANQQALDRADLERYAQQVGLNMEQFKRDLEMGTGKDTIKRDAAEGERNGVSGTPAVYMNGLKYQGPRGYPAEGLEAVARSYLGLGD
ncbi:MAG: hypothetical protein EXR79_04820 [Myxococcales bacterium]|nr:hypothetical protein [Myxococcales bacterium]